MSTSIDTGSAVSGEASRRGNLVVEKRVVERIAGQAASECSDTGGASGGVLGIGAQADLTARPAPVVELVGQSATVALDLTVAYPAPIRAATDRIRAHIVRRVHELTGVEVSRVDITVTALPRPATGPRKVN